MERGKLKSLDFSENQALEFINVPDNALSGLLDLSDLEDLSFLLTTGNTSLETICVKDPGAVQNDSRFTIDDVTEFKVCL